ncbi:signal peptidase II [Sulfobacillus harzensis]|uniref:Lipoprotein signal peptidase n=1 Tax=Sulfobacillus harzensis TaxID=2729629 RepID=A0A7Y0Q1L2_9FIRM|nr:signal peptidase II [Sulfobacillus harzensis]NMP21440.1 signal peptidase II [Sulfobacillus harzensis]
MKKWLWVFGVIAIAAFDLWSADLAAETLPFATPVPVWGHVLRWELIHNRGAMLGLGGNHPALITILGILGVALLTVAAWRWPRYGAPLAMMTGGAVGNVMSRLIYGHVTDFIRVFGYPGIFNLADVFLRVGVIWLVIQFFLVGRQVAPKATRETS